VGLAYASAGLRIPRVAWCSSPVELVKLVQRTLEWDHRAPIGRNIRTQLFDRVERRMLAAARRAAGGRQIEEWRATSAKDVRYGIARRLRGYIEEEMQARAERPLRRLLNVLLHRGSDAAGEALSTGGFGPPDYSDLAVCEVFQEVTEAYAFQGLSLLAANVGWAVPYENICWLSERPVVVQTDARTRLHNGDGPALRYADGWSVFDWKGTRVPRWMIDEKTRITPAAINSEPSPRVRRCMIEILTPEKYVAMGEPARVAEDETGVLWRKWWPGDSWAAVEVVNGTSELDGTRKRYFLQVPGDMRSASSCCLDVRDDQQRVCTAQRANVSRSGDTMSLGVGVRIDVRR
jgi:hypothetical protein